MCCKPFSRCPKDGGFIRRHCCTVCRTDWFRIGELSPRQRTRRCSNCANDVFAFGNHRYCTWCGFREKRWPPSWTGSKLRHTPLEGEG